MDYKDETFWLMKGDCLERMKDIPDGSVDAIVTDPPYGLSKEPDMAEVISKWLKGEDYTHKGSGFMGKSWDSFVPGPSVWKECFRVLKPGGHLITFFGTRTYDMGTLAVRLAGFEIRDQLAWIFGCLDEASEILTENGWKLGKDVQEGELVASWDSTRGSISLSPVRKTFSAPFSGEMVVFKNDNTEQVLTPNHRVYHKSRKRRQINGARKSWYDTEWEVAEASAINRWNPIKLPLAGFADGPGIGGIDVASLLGWVWTDGGFDNTGNGVRIWQSESANPEKVKEIDELMIRTTIGHKRYDRDRTYTYKEVSKPVSETCWFFTGEMSTTVRNHLPNKKLSWDLIWKMTVEEKTAFYEAAMKGDGSGTSFYQKDENDLLIFQTLCHLIGKQARLGTKKKKRCVYIHNNPVTELQNRHLKSSLTIQYDGLVWCVSVDTGAFVARKNGKIFITGNSGFPKSHNIGKAIDKAAGVEREVIGQQKGKGGENLNKLSRVGKNDSDDANGIGAYGIGAKQTTIDIDITAPATDDAKKWEGWGTALKPAFEPILLARKPLISTVAQNVLEHGTGAINIDGCRVNSEVLDSERRTSTPSAGIWGNGSKHPQKEGDQRHNPLGRWPANLIHDGSEEVLAAFPETTSGALNAEVQRGKFGQNGVYGTSNGNGKGRDYTSDSGSAARFFYCAKASKKDRDEGLEGFELKPGAGLPMRSVGGEQSGEGLDGTKTDRTTHRRNIHPTVKPTELMRYLCRLVTQPGGVILDPFLGSGSTGKAAAAEGFNFIGIEMDDAYFDIAKARILNSVKPKLLENFFESDNS